ncbi:hypothetical protein AAMO2058_000345900 [Amorphochlora amoebiformis]
MQPKRRPARMRAWILPVLIGLLGFVFFHRSQGSNTLTSWLCCIRGVCQAVDTDEGISQHLPMSPPRPPARLPRIFRRRSKAGNSDYMKRVAQKAIQVYKEDLDMMYQDFRRNVNKRRDSSWEQTVSKESHSLQFESYRRPCPNDMGAIEYDQRTVYENASVSQLEKFYGDDTHRAASDGSTEHLEILAEDKATECIVIYQLVRYPWPLINREYVYVRRRFNDGDKFYYVMKAVNGRELLPNEEAEEDWRSNLCTSVCTSARKQRVDDFTCLICFSSAKSRNGADLACEWRQMGREDFGIKNALLTRAAKVAASKSLWPFQCRLEDTFRCYATQSGRRGSRQRSKGSFNPVRPLAGAVGWVLGKAGRAVQTIAEGAKKEIDAENLNNSKE